MNEHFVCIKVDREERPDIDAICMEACQAMTGHGGWPLNTFLDPDQVPFYCGTYFPPEPRHGLPSWRMVLLGVSRSVGESPRGDPTPRPSGSCRRWTRAPGSRPPPNRFARS